MTIPEQKSGVLGFETTLNTKTNPFVPTRDFYQFDGWYLSEGLSITKRRGFQKLNQTVLVEVATPATFTGIWEYTPSVVVSGVKQVATTQKGLYVYNTPTADAWNAIALTNAGGARTGTGDQLFDSAILLDQMYIGNGKDTNIRFDANAATPTAYQMGITAPAVKNTVSAPAAGGSMAAGVYSYKYTFVNVLGQESNPSPKSDDVTITGGSGNYTVNLSAVAVSSDPQVTKRNIYRTTVNGGLWLLLATLADNSTTVYADTNSDAALTIAVEGFSNGVPPKFSMIDIYKGVAFMAGDPNNLSRVWFSGNSKPACVDSNDYRDLDANDGDIVTGLKRYLTTMVVFKNGSIWNAIGDDRTNFGFQRMDTAVGSVNNAGIVDVPVRGVLAFMSPTARFYFYNGVSSSPAAENIEPTLNGLNLSKLSKVVGTTVPSLNQCRWIVPNGGANNCDLVIWYDYLLNKWGTFSLSAIPGNYCTSMYDSSHKKQFYVGHSDGYVRQGDAGGTDDGTPIACQAMDRGHPNPSGNSENNKVFSHIFVFFKPTPGVTLSVYGHLNDPDNAMQLLGTIDASKASGQDHIHINKKCRRLYIHVVETSTVQGLVLRGWQLYFKDVGQHNAP
jgi:hypothetical protein